ncbi:pyridoxal phosphate-dependent aminotransferase [Nocardiopsis suaedae]|uniref:Aminotransferase n=1 Tax=Nocardiopsis suaedae TaxID=3018444 RepID=A0ABT4TJ49_9ACTN|nr:aminotransferase class I/II-fold pyridoxal phosphate-dependent enzyme [Nocardiopsis suaedae]MDA2804730.1 aminotransferase class I/II-fold pyridoxal phosphate-dependent enzyme [Nocardiopsis suaedae]
MSLSPTAAVSHGDGVIALTTGDVRVPVHPERGAAAPRRGDQPYPPPAGDAELRSLVAEQASRSAAEVPADAVLIAPGARVAALVVLRAAAEGGDVLLPAPYWASYPAVIGAAGATAVPVPGDVGTGVRAADLEAARTPATRAVVVNSPRNPDGALTPAEDLAAIADWAGRNGVTVLFDEVYRGVPLRGGRAPSALDLFGTLPDHCAVLDGLSKSHALAGLRIGWALASGGLLKRAQGLASHLVGGVSAAVQATAAEAVRDRGLPERVGGPLTENMRRAAKTLDALPGVDCPEPGGGIFLFPDLSRWLRERAPEAARHDPVGWLRGEHGVAVVDGAAFGAPGHVRLSFALPADRLDTGLGRLRAALEGGGHG